MFRSAHAACAQRYHPLAAAPTSDTEKKKQKPGEFKTPPRLRHRSGIEPDVSLSKIYVRDFEELASAFVRFACVRFARVRSLAPDLLASDLLASDLLA